MTSLPAPIVRRLINGIGLAELPPEQQEQYLLKFESLIDQAVTGRILDMLSEGQAHELQVLMEGAADELQARDRFQAYVRSTIPNLAVVVDEEADRLIAFFETRRDVRAPVARDAKADPAGQPAAPADPLAEGPREEIAAAVTDLSTTVSDALQPNTPDLLGADNLLADLAVGPSNKVLSQRERMRWVADKTGSALIDAAIFLWIWMLVSVFAKRFAASGSVRGLPDWIPLLLPGWLTKLTFGLQLLIVIAAGILTMYGLVQLKIAWVLRYHGPRRRPRLQG
jgi:hypothetical protein